MREAALGLELDAQKRSGIVFFFVFDFPSGCVAEQGAPILQERPSVSASTLAPGIPPLPALPTFLSQLPLQAQAELRRDWDDAREQYILGPEQRRDDLAGKGRVSVCSGRVRIILVELRPDDSVDGPVERGLGLGLELAEAEDEAGLF